MKANINHSANDNENGNGLLQYNEEMSVMKMAVVRWPPPWLMAIAVWPVLPMTILSSLSSRSDLQYIVMTWPFWSAHGEVMVSEACPTSVHDSVLFYTVTCDFMCAIDLRLTVNNVFFWLINETQLYY